ncbi:hypothetical protein H0H81_001292 [Sphagnurus paluster]|uniref:DUF7704 domain-containing protein n=1 Tax=Sphagnurus paluster TaxID=117069 RepID=A0A9P7FVU7_9AGAR|nr:hypothetical protein H0H81_001292 [Sphagnurus paluster]
MKQTSAIPDFYYFIFAVYEPFLTFTGFIGAIIDPQGTHNAQAPWRNSSPPPATLPQATIVTIIQLGHVCALVGAVNCFILSAARRHLHDQVALQERIAFALLTPLMVGDLLHLYVTLWALGDQRWNFRNWSPMLWATILLGLTLIIPRIAWHLGVGRYVDSRDGATSRSYMREKR